MTMEGTIWKFTLDAVKYQDIDMPEGAKILSVGNQRGQICMWASVDPENPKESRRFTVIGTGHDLPLENIELIGMVMLMGGDLIFHVFEVI